MRRLALIALCVAAPHASVAALLGPHFLLASYTDLVHRDGTFPTVPVYSQEGFLVYRNDFFSFGGDFSPQVVEQPAPIPEPATTVLLGIGLAWIARQRQLAARSRK